MPVGVQGQARVPGSRLNEVHGRRSGIDPDGSLIDPSGSMPVRPAGNHSPDPGERPDEKGPGVVEGRGERNALGECPGASGARDERSLVQEGLTALLRKGIIRKS